MLSKIRSSRTFLNLMICCVLLSACGGNAAPTEYVPPPLPTPIIDYQVVGTTKSNFMVVVDPESSTDREGLNSIGDYLCTTSLDCIVWIWDDINQAARQYPLTDLQRQAMVAEFTFDFLEADSFLVIYALGEE